MTTDEDYYWRKGRPRHTEGCKACFSKPSAETIHRRMLVEQAANDASQANAHRSRSRWTDGEIEALVTYWPDMDIKIEDIAKDLGRSLFAVRVKANQLAKSGYDVPDRRVLRLVNTPPAPEEN